MMNELKASSLAGGCPAISRAGERRWLVLLTLAWPTW